MSRKKILYFEGVGCAAKNDVPNCRIRTAFTNKNGKMIYLELVSNEKGKIYCSRGYYITNNPNINDSNQSKMYIEHQAVNIQYTKAGILKFVNRYCNAAFKSIMVLDEFSGYHVHNINGQQNTPAAYQFSDTFVYDATLTDLWREKVKTLKQELCSYFDLPYDNSLYWVDSDKNLCVRLYLSQEKLDAVGWTKGKELQILKADVT